MEKLNLTKAQIIEELNKGKIIRTTCGIWNDPNKRGEIKTSVESINKFYDWACHIDVYKSSAEGIDYDLIGASGCDMF